MCKTLLIPITRDIKANCDEQEEEILNLKHKNRIKSSQIQQLKQRFGIKMNDGTIKNIIIENYDAEEIVNELNNPDKNMMAIRTGKELL